MYNECNIFLSLFHFDNTLKKPQKFIDAKISFEIVKTKRFTAKIKITMREI